MNEVTTSGYARSSFQRKVRLKSVANPNSNWKVPQLKTGAKIKDMDKKYRNAYVEINRVLLDEKLVFKRMQQLFDAFDGTYRQPEFFRKQYELFPELGAWL